MYSTVTISEVPANGGQRRTKKRRVNASTNSRPTNQEPVTPIVEELVNPIVEEPVNPIVEEPVDCYMKMNNSGTVIEGGEVFSISGSDVHIGVKRVLTDCKAEGSLVVGNTVMEDVTVTTPIDRLASAKHPLRGRDRQKLEQFSLLSRRDNLRDDSFAVRKSVRRTLLGKMLLKEVQSGMRLASFKKTFSLGIVCPEFDFSIFDFDDRCHKVEFSYALSNLSCLDSLLGNFWDVQSPSGNCNFVTRITLKVKDLQIFGKVSYARCRMTLPKNYRPFLSKHDIMDTETEVEDVELE